MARFHASTALHRTGGLVLMTGVGQDGAHGLSMLGPSLATHSAVRSKVIGVGASPPVWLLCTHCSVVFVVHGWLVWMWAWRPQWHCCSSCQIMQGCVTGVGLLLRGEGPLCLHVADLLTRSSMMPGWGGGGCWVLYGPTRPASMPASTWRCCWGLFMRAARAHYRHALGHCWMRGPRIGCKQTECPAHAHTRGLLSVSDGVYASLAGRAEGA